MKSCFVTMACLLTIAGHLQAQQPGNALLADKMPSLSLTGGINKIHAKAVRDFLKRNETATHADWMPVDKGYVVKYEDANNLSCKTVYNSIGCYKYTIKQYGEDKMDEAVRRLVKTTYYDYIITLIEEVDLPLKPAIYIVHVQDAHTLKNLRVSEGYVEVIEDYRKL